MTTKCPECEGDGIILGKRCGDCDGTGIRKEPRPARATPDRLEDSPGYRLGRAQSIIKGLLSPNTVQRDIAREQAEKFLENEAEREAKFRREVAS